MDENHSTGTRIDVPILTVSTFIMCVVQISFLMVGWGSGSHIGVNVEVPHCVVVASAIQCTIVPRVGHMQIMPVMCDIADFPVEISRNFMNMNGGIVGDQDHTPTHLESV
jgi:hypothetical protein